MIRFYSHVAVVVIVLCLSFQPIMGQTSWKGTVSTSWKEAANWTAGMPTSSMDAIIGDANFTGSFQPSITGSAACKSLTLGGAHAATLTMTRTLTVPGNITINSNGTISQGKTSITLSGNWSNSGSYSATSTSSNVIFAGTSQTLGGSAVTTFRKLTVNAGSTLTLNSNVTVSGSSSLLTVKGTLNPNESPTYTVTTTSLTVNAGAVLKVNAATFAGNYSVSGTLTLNATSTVEYSATAVNQTVSNTPTYGTLKISGAGTKTLAGNLPSLASSSSAAGNIYVAAGTLDLSTFTANRGTSVAGGVFTVLNGATLKIGGTNTFPSNYATTTLSLTSTVEYSGISQTVAAKTYGNLTLSSSSGAAVKTFPGSAFTIAGNLTSTIGAGSSVSFTAAAALSISGNISIGASTTFNGGSFTHTVAGNWVNNGTFTGSTSNITFTTGGSSISGTGTNNFNDLTFSGSNVTAAGATTLTIAGNITTSGPGSFTHSSGGTTTLSGTSKTISGTDMTFDNLTVSGTISSANTITVTGNLSVSGSFTTSAGAVIMSGTSRTISGAGTKTFSSLNITGTITTAVNLSINSALNVGGSFTASAGTITFTGASSLNGTANLFNVTLNGTSLQLSTNAVLGIAGVYTVSAGTLNVTSTIPNTVNFNGSGAQNVNGGTYHHLTVSNGNTKTAAGAITTNGDLTISTGTTFSAGSFTHTINGNWSNAGTFTAGTSTITLTGGSGSSITGATTFNILTINKTAAATVVQLNNNISVPTLNMTTGSMQTGANTVTITSTRTGNGIILGNIQRTHSFSTGTAYAFEGPQNTITFSSVSSVTSITVSVVKGAVTGFPFSSSVNRSYAVSVPSGTYTATLRLHYEDDELNGNTESSIALWDYNGTNWISAGTSGNNTSSNYVDLAGLTNISLPWTLSDNANILQWTGAASTDWNTPGNWTVVQGSPGATPTATDIVQIGAAAFTNQPAITTTANARNILFGSTQAATLTLNAGGSLTVAGNISGSWSSNVTHTINANAQSLTVNGDFPLSDGTSGHAINLSASSGNITVGGSLTESGGANISFSGAGTLSIAGNFNYSSGTFTAGPGTVIYNGSNAQNMGGVTYNNLTINNSGGGVSSNTATTIGGNLSVSGGTLNLNAGAAVTGDIAIGAGATLNGGSVTASIGGNWTNSGSFIPGSGTMQFNGLSGQTISASNFNNLIINKASGTATLLGNVSINSDLTLSGGTLDIGSFTASRSSSGGTLTLSNSATLLVGGATNFPANYISDNLSAGSTVNYNGTSAQSIAAITYGSLSFNNGGAKSLTGLTTIGGDLTIGTGASLNAGSNTISLNGSWTNNGSFTPSTSTLLLNGSGKTITGNTTFNRVTVYGSYTVAGSDITYNGFLNITSTGSFAAGSGTATVNGDLTNSGSLTSNGTTTFSGTALQTIRLLNAVVSNSSGIINFNGNVSPVLNSTSTPTFANLNINNTAGVNPSVGWTVLISFTVNSGAIFNGGPSTHIIAGAFTNNGTVTSTGIINFTPPSAVNVNLGSGFSSTGTVIFGGTGVITLSGTSPSLQDVVIANTNATGLTLPSGWTIGDDLTVNSNAIFNAGTSSFTVGGDMESDGTLNGGSSTITLASPAGTLSGSSGTAFNNLTITGSITANSDFQVAGDLTDNGTLDASIGTPVMTGSSAATVGGSASPVPIAQLTINKNKGVSVSLGKDLSTLTSLHIAGGILDAGAFNLTQDATNGGELVIDDSAVLRIGGTNTLPAFNTYTFDTLSTVEYAGSTQSIPSTVNYGNLSITAAGTKTPSAALTILNDFTLSNGTFTGGSFTHLIGGNWNMTGGTFTNTGTTIQMNGTANQSISSTGAFNNLTINKTSGLVTLGSNATINNTLTFSAGKMSLLSNNLTMGSSGTISGASAANYIIAEGAGTLIQSIANGSSRSFPIGTTANYIPAAIALTPASTADNFAVNVLNAVYLSGTTGAAATSGAVNATWLIGEGTAGGSDATVTLQWPGSLELPGFNRSAARLAHYISSNWDYGLSDIPATGSDPYTLSRSGFTSFSPFAVSSLGALPLTWLNVSGKNIGHDNYIHWSTAAETGNDHFAVEVSPNGADFTEIGRVPSQPSSSGAGDYSFIHRNVTLPLAYYRIKQVDLDGRFSYSKVIAIAAVDAAGTGFRYVTSPAYERVSALIAGTRSFSTDILLLDMAGKILQRQSLTLNKGSNLVDISLNGVAKGIYILQYRNEFGKIEVARFVK